MSVQTVAVAASAIAVAKRLDETMAARDTAALSAEIRHTLAVLRELGKVGGESDPVDDLERKRQSRRAAAAAAART